MIAIINVCKNHSWKSTFWMVESFYTKCILSSSYTVAGDKNSHIYISIKTISNQKQIPEQRWPEGLILFLLLMNSFAVSRAGHNTTTICVSHLVHEYQWNGITCSPLTIIAWKNENVMENLMKHQQNVKEWLEWSYYTVNKYLWWLTNIRIHDLIYKY